MLINDYCTIMINPSALNPSVDTSIINMIPSIIDPEIKSEYNTRVSIILGYRIIQKIQHWEAPLYTFLS